MSHTIIIISSLLCELDDPSYSRPVVVYEHPQQQAVVDAAAAAATGNINTTIKCQHQKKAVLRTVFYFIKSVTWNPVVVIRCTTIRLQHTSTWCNNYIPRSGSVEFFVRIWWLWLSYYSIQYYRINSTHKMKSPRRPWICVFLYCVPHDRKRIGVLYSFSSSNEKFQSV